LVLYDGSNNNCIDNIILHAWELNVKYNLTAISILKKAIVFRRILSCIIKTSGYSLE